MNAEMKTTMVSVQPQQAKEVKEVVLTLSEEEAKDLAMVTGWGHEISIALHRASGFEAVSAFDRLHRSLHRTLDDALNPIGARRVVEEKG